MIMEKVIDTTNVLCKELSSRNIKLSPVNNSPVERLVEALYAEPSVQYKLMSDNKCVLEYASDIENDSGTYIDILDKEVSSYASFINNGLFIYKNEVRPIMVEYMNELDNLLIKYMPCDPLSTLQIDVLDIPSILNDSTIWNTINKAKDFKRTLSSNGLNMGDANLSEIKASLTRAFIGSKVSIVDWTVTLSDGFIINTWDKYVKGSDGWHMSNINDSELSAIDKLNTLLFIYLIASGNIVDSVDENDISNTIKVMNSYKIRTQVSIQIASIVNIYKAYEATGVIVLNSSTKEKKIIVYGPTYRKWLKEPDNTVEVMYGSIVDTDNRVTAHELNESRDYLNSIWKAYQSTHRVRHYNSRLDTFRNVIKLAYDKVNMVSEFEEEAREETDNYNNIQNDLLVKYISNIVNTDMTDLEKVVREVICGIRFYYTDALEFFTLVNEVTDISPELNIKQAVTLATTCYVADFVAKQITVER